MSRPADKAAASPLSFHRNIAAALADGELRHALDNVRGKFTSARAAAVLRYESEGGDFESLRARGRRIRDDAVRRMPSLLRQFERNAAAAGTQVLWAKDAAAARRLCAEIARRHRVKLAVKSKSMATEEIELNGALQAAGAEVVETDMGEFLVQQAGQPPSHIIAPAMHLRREKAAAILRKAVHVERDDIASLVAAARGHLRKKFLQADMGIGGANFLIADTGSALMVTNEGNGRMTSTLPPVHIVVAGIDKIVARWSDIPPLLNLLARSATGQRFSNYVSVNTGARRHGESEGPKHAYVVLLDNGRSALRASDCSDMLRCIRCGACMNHCPVYHSVGGHAFAAAYMGPMGQVLIPSLRGLEAAPEFPHAATMCGACAVVCPVRIPLPDLMRRLRRRQARQNMRPLKERWLIKAWFFLARRPALYAAATAAAARLLKIWGGGEKQIRALPLARGWFSVRNLAAPPGKTFRARCSD